MNRRPTHWMPALLLMLTVLALASCPGADPYVDRYGIWQVDSIDYPSSTGTASEPWIKLSKDALVTFVYYTYETPDPPPPEWRHCTIRSGTVTSIDADSITFTEDYDGASVVVDYTFDGTTFLITWPDDEVYHMTVAGALPYPEADALSSACFN
jgi:hypothetical protein